ncbi:MAG TPA: hypothetical protein VGN81_29400, partial [Pseudonocardiaceae bacterium]
KPGAELVSVVAALLDGMDLVVVNAAGLSRAGRRGGELAKRLSARARHRGAVLISAGEWPGADLDLSCTELRWSGLRMGRGYLAEGELVISATGRGAATRHREHLAVLPCAAGTNPANPNSAAPMWTGPVGSVVEELAPVESLIAAVG